MTVAAAARTVGHAMLRRPTVHPAELTVGRARAAFEASPKTHLLLLVRNEILLGTVTRADLDGDLDPDTPAADAGALTRRTIGPDVPLAPVHALMRSRDIRRLAVVNDAMRVLGLLCLKSSRTGFCTDEGVRAMRQARALQTGA